MNNRYRKLAEYKSRLDYLWLLGNKDEYNTLLYQVKLDKFKILRNSNGNHKLVDKLGEEKKDSTDMFNEIFGGIFRK